MAEDNSDKSNPALDNSLHSNVVSMAFLSAAPDRPSIAKKGRFAAIVDTEGVERIISTGCSLLVEDRKRRIHRRRLESD